MTDLWPLAKPVMNRVAPETAHGWALSALRAGLVPKPAIDRDDGIRIGNLSFRHPVGLAAGFDKQADVGPNLFRLGISFAELGGVTPEPQQGNAKPRLFRSSVDRAVINRFGLNSDGVAAVARRLAAVSKRWPGPVGVNIGPNKDSPDPIGDYARLATMLAPLVDFLTINVSSPNTAGLRDLQGRAALAKIVGRTAAAVAEASSTCQLWVKVAPDLSREERGEIAAVLIDNPVAAIVVGNTTVVRPDGLEWDFAKETGGLSGRPLFPYALEGVEGFARLLQGRLPIIGCGGIDDVARLNRMLDAGATLVQLYSALVFEGPGFVPRLLREQAR